MADEDDASKSEEPTDKKLGDAKRKGQVAQSQEVKSWAILLVGTGALIFMAPTIANNVRATGRLFIEKPHEIVLSTIEMRTITFATMTEVLLILAPIFSILALTAIAANVGQFGFTVSTEKIKPDPGKLNLLKGAKKLLSPKAFMEFFKGLFKLSMVSLVTSSLAIPLLLDIELLPQIPFVHSLDRIHQMAILLAAGTVGVMTILAVIDFVYQKYTFMKQMRMTKQEVKDERKQQDGDPKIKQRIAALRMERQRERMMQAIGKADVIITNPTHYAIALQYDMDTMPAPILVGKGLDSLAMRIREVAEENDIPIVENPPLARALYASVEIDEEIPAEHFHAVAEVIGYVFRLKGRLNHVDQAAADQGAQQAAQAEHQQNE